MRRHEIGRGVEKHTLLDAVLLVIARGLGVGDALDALIEVVLGRRALLGIPAFCRQGNVVSFGPDRTGPGGDVSVGFGNRPSRREASAATGHGAEGWRSSPQPVLIPRGGSGVTTTRLLRSGGIDNGIGRPTFLELVLGVDSLLLLFFFLLFLLLLLLCRLLLSSGLVLGGLVVGGGGLGLGALLLLGSLGSGLLGLCVALSG